MPRFVPLIVMMCLLVTPAQIWAQESGTYSGQYSTIQTAVDTVRAQDGSMVLKFSYELTQIVDDRDGPFAHMLGRCWGTAVLGNEDTPIGAGGACHLTDGQGNGYWQWWHQEASTSDECPIRCGTYGDYGGYGTFEGYSSQGRWNALVIFPSGSGFGAARARFTWN